MTREQLEHLIRAAGAILECDEIVVVGSQAILAAYPDAPPALRASMEADLYPNAEPTRSDIVDGAIGELSLFHETYGYYAHGVGPETAALPSAWRSRALLIETPNTRGVRGICPAPADLAASKLVAGREKDLAFVRVLLADGLVHAAEIDQVLTELPAAQRTQAADRLGGLQER